MGHLRKKKLINFVVSSLLNVINFRHTLTEHGLVTLGGWREFKKEEVFTKMSSSFYLLFIFSNPVPNVGLKLATPRPRVAHSTDRTSQAPLELLYFKLRGKRRPLKRSDNTWLCLQPALGKRSPHLGYFCVSRSLIFSNSKALQALEIQVSIHSLGTGDEPASCWHCDPVISEPGDLGKNLFTLRAVASSSWSEVRGQQYPYLQSVTCHLVSGSVCWLPWSKVALFFDYCGGQRNKSIFQYGYNVHSTSHAFYGIFSMRTTTMIMRTTMRNIARTSKTTPVLEDTPPV